MTSRQRRLSPPVCPHTSGGQDTKAFVRKENERYEEEIRTLSIVLAMYVDGPPVDGPPAPELMRSRAFDSQIFAGSNFRGLTPQRTPKHGGIQQTNCNREKGEDFCSRRFGHRAVRSQMPENCASRALWPSTALWPNLLPL